MVDMYVYDSPDCYDDFHLDHTMHESLICAHNDKNKYKWRDPGSPLVTLVGGTDDTYQLIGVDHGDPGNPWFSR